MPAGDGQFWTRAYPRRWREAHGEELLEGVVDLAGPDTRRPAARGAFALVRGGWATRWREHPPLHRWLLYRMFDSRLPAESRSWALDDIDGLTYPMRRYLAVVWWYPVIMVATRSENAAGWTGWYLAVIALISTATMVMWPEKVRSRAGLRHVVPRFGEVPVEGALVAWDGPGWRSSARSALTWAALFLGMAAAASVVAALFAPKVIQVIPIPAGAEFAVAPVGRGWIVAVAVLALALGVGVLGGFVARGRLRRLLGQRPAQPYRVLYPVSGPGKVNVLVWAGLIGALAWLEASGRLVLGLSVVLGAVALFLLPGVLVALVVTRGDLRDLAGRDVWWIATRGRVPTVDRPAPVLRPLPGPDTEAGAGLPQPVLGS